jgi:hypothetical protein
MSFTKKIRTGARGKAALAVLGVLIAAVALVAWVVARRRAARPPP